MGIVSLPPEMNPGEPIDCAICAVRIALTGATAGQHNGRGCQMFACVSHFMEVELLVLGWADFVIQDRERELKAGREPRYQRYKGDGPDVRLNS